MSQKQNWKDKKPGMYCLSKAAYQQKKLSLLHRHGCGLWIWQFSTSGKMVCYINCIWSMVRCVRMMTDGAKEGETIRPLPEIIGFYWQKVGQLKLNVWQPSRQNRGNVPHHSLDASLMGSLRIKTHRPLFISLQDVFSSCCEALPCRHYKK